MPSLMFQLDTPCRFGPFLLDVRKRTLVANGIPVELTPKTFDVLVALVEGDGVVVSKDQLMERVWPNTFVDEANLAQQVSILRKRLAAHDEGESYVSTIPGRGYAFSAPLVRVTTDDATPAAA